MTRKRRIGDNGGPPLDDHRGPSWGKGDAHKFIHWRSAHRAAWKPKSRDVALFRLEKAEKLGLSYEEYTLELMERGRHLQVEDRERVEAIKRDRPRRRGIRHLP